MSKQAEAQSILPEYIEMLRSNLMKLEHDMKKLVQVAIVADDKHLSEKAARIYVSLHEIEHLL